MDAIGFDLPSGGIRNDRHAAPARRNTLITDLSGGCDDSLIATGLTLTGGTTQAETFSRGHFGTYDLPGNPTLYAYDLKSSRRR
jgi:hypothetical protein